MNQRANPSPVSEVTYMSDELNYVRETAKALGLRIPEDREAAVAEAIAETLKQVDEIRADQTAHPQSTAFDAAWSEKK